MPIKPVEHAIPLGRTKGEFAYVCWRGRVRGAGAASYGLEAQLLIGLEQMMRLVPCAALLTVMAMLGPESAQAQHGCGLLDTCGVCRHRCECARRKLQQPGRPRCCCCQKPCCRARTGIWSHQPGGRGQHRLGARVPSASPTFRRDASESTSRIASAQPQPTPDPRFGFAAPRPAPRAQGQLITIPSKRSSDSQETNGLALRGTQITAARSDDNMAQQPRRDQVAANEPTRYPSAVAVWQTRRGLVGR